jgi:lysophospholipase L1-like esterase
MGSAVMNASEDAQEFALGLDNTAYFPKDNNSYYHCSDFEYFPIQNCLDSFIAPQKSHSSILLTGNSQLHGINQPDKGLNSTSQILYQSLKDQNNRFLAVSVPNMNLQEQLLLNIYIASKIPISHMIIAASFDNTRETSIRESLIPALKEQQVLQSLERLSFGKKIIQTYGEKDNAGNNLSIEEDNLQQKVEKILDKSLVQQWSAWGMRERLRFRSIVEVYQLRNRVLGITPNSIRKKIPARYVDNLESLRNIMEFASQKGIKVLVYSPPIRSDQKLPYNLDEFDSFKDDIQDIAEAYNFNFADFQSKVPSQYWGFVSGTDSNTGDKEIDFMHFQGEGHTFLAKEILATIDQMEWFKDQ